MNRSIRFAVLLVFGMAVSAVLGGGAWLATSLHWLWPTGENRITTPGLEQGGLEKPVQIVRDENGVPAITAETDNDAYFALGFVHAQDRFWQMEMMRRFGAGRLAEILGAPALASDKWMRTLGLYRLAERQVKDLADPVRETLEAYAKGVNYWMQTDFGLPALEFALLRYKPEPWKLADSLVWGKIMAARLGGNWRDEVLRARMAKRIAPEKVRELWPAYPSDAPITIAGVDRETAVKAVAGLETLAPWPLGAPKGASNVWALAPSRTDTGGALLANDPHLGFQVPVMWYLARINSPGLQLTGATVPGVPFHILGHNGRIAWGITSTQSDVTDLFIEKLADGDPEQYVSVDGAQAFVTRDETINVKGSAPVPLAVRESNHGPVISDLRPGMGPIIGEDHVVALAATYLQPDDISAAAFYELNRAKDWIDFNRALSKFQGSQQNFAYADQKGNIGLLTAGLAPQRAGGQGYVPTAGWTGETDWNGFVPFGELPKLYKPTDGAVINANNRLVPEDFQHFLGHDWAPPYRAQRIIEMLADDGFSGSSGHARMQRDPRSLMSEELLALMLEVKPETPLAKKAVARLRKWKGVMARDRSAPLIFMAWLRTLNRQLYGDELGDLTAQFLGPRPLLVKSILTRRQHWCDDTGTDDKQETCAEILLSSLEAALADLVKRHGKDWSAWRWGDVHVATFPHPLLTHVPVLGRIADLSIESDGGDATVNRGAMRLNDNASPFAHIHGAGYRAVYDLSNLNKSRYIIATGQSGNPLSSNYSDQLEPWRNGAMYRLGGSRKTSSERSGFILTPDK
jgi:penicillin G amidase